MFSFARIAYAHTICVRTRMRLYLRALARTHLDPREFACVHMHKWRRSFLHAFACVRLRACYRAGLIKSQNAFTRKKSQNSNALWVQKFSGCTIVKNGFKKSGITKALDKGLRIGFTCKRTSKDMTITLGLRRIRLRRRIPIFFYFTRCIHILRYYSDVIHSFDWKSAVEHDGGV